MAGGRWQGHGDGGGTERRRGGGLSLGVSRGSAWPSAGAASSMMAVTQLNEAQRGPAPAQAWCRTGTPKPVASAPSAQHPHRRHLQGHSKAWPLASPPSPRTVSPRPCSEAWGVLNPRSASPCFAADAGLADTGHHSEVLHRHPRSAHPWPAPRQPLHGPLVTGLGPRGQADPPQGRLAWC